MSRPGIEPGSQELASCAITARPPQHDTTGPRHRAFDVFQGSCYTILLPSARHPARGSKPSSATSVTGIQLESGAREETGRFRDVKRCVATGDRTKAWISGIGLLRHITARPPQHDTTGPRHIAFDMFQGSCYTLPMSVTVISSLYGNAHAQSASDGQRPGFRDRTNPASRSFGAPPSAGS